MQRTAPDQGRVGDRPAGWRRPPPLAIAWAVVVVGFASVITWLWWEAPPDPQQSPSSAPISAAPADTGKTAKTRPEPAGGRTAPSPKAAPRSKQTAALPPVPDPALVAETEKGPLPIVSADGRHSWRVYARPFDAPPNAPRIAIVIGDMGLSDMATRVAIERLPAPVTLAFNPYADRLQMLIRQSRDAGHEVMLQLPMEPATYPAEDPGPHALLTTLSPDANLARLEWLLGRFTGYVGVTNYMGAKFIASPDDLRPVMQALAARGLMFVDSGATGRSVAEGIARDLGMPLAIGDKLIDGETSRAAIDARLADLERIARTSGTAVGFGYPFPVTVERIARWAAQLDGKGIHLAPASAIADRRQGTLETQ